MTNDGTPPVGADPAVARARLVREKERVEALIAEVRAELDAERAAGAAELAHVDQHPADEASDTFEREKDLSILESLERELAEIEAAIRRIEDGTYGIDEQTGEPIAPERLEALPTARTNVPHPPGRPEQEER
jgi:RNA polymerase-binding transcription factor DksA